MTHKPVSRREAFTRAGKIIVAASVMPSLALAHHREDEIEATPIEDLMQEHGLLNRIFLVYEAAMRGLVGGGDVPMDALAAAAKVLNVYIEEHHERDEEEHIFPRLLAAGKIVETVNTLLIQHKMGREITQIILRLSQRATLSRPAARAELSQALQRFVSMYRPHAAREDTLIFPTFRDTVSVSEYAEIAERMEEEEHQRFGDDGFSEMRKMIEGVEEAFAIDQLILP